MDKNIEYEFYNGEFNTAVNREKESVTMYERGGWSRSYHLTFKELLVYAEQWDVKVDLNADDKTVAENATNIILANHASEHGLDPFRYVPRTNKITDPKDVNTIKKFEKLLEKYTPQQVDNLLTEKTKHKLQKLFIK